MTRGRLAILVFVLAALAGAAAWLVFRPPGVSPPERSGTAPALGEESAAEPEGRGRGVERAPSSRIVPRSGTAQEDEPETGPGIRVQVVDASGQPAGGVRVLLALESGGAVGSAWTSAPTDQATGIAMVAIPRDRVSVSDPRWFVTVDTPFVDAPEVDLDPSNLPAEPVRIALGPTGRAEVLVRDAAGDLVTERTLVTLIDITREGSKPRLMLPQACARATTDGRVVFERVGLGTRLKACARGDGRRYPECVKADGPRVASAAVTITVRPEVGSPIVKGRVVDADHRPLARQEFPALVFVDDARTRLAIRTDSEGRFRAEILEDVPRGSRRTLEIRIERGMDVVVASGAVDLTRALPPGDTDVGDVVLVDPPLIAAGRVIDEAGRPVGGATLRLEPAAWGAPDATSFRERSERPRGRWFIASQLALPSEEDGSFEIRGRDEGPFQLQAVRSGFWSDAPVPIETGQKDVVLRVRRGGRIEGSIVMPQGLSREELSVTAVLEDQKLAELRPDGAGFSQPPREDGSFAFDGLRPGKFWFKVEIRNEEVVLAEVRGIEVVAGEITRDPRLQKMDLSCMGRLVTLSVVDAENHLIPGAEAAEVAERVAGRMVPGTVARGHDGKVQIRLRRKSPEVMVGAPGFRRVVIPAVDSDRTVALEAGLPVRVSVSGSLVREGVWIDARVEAEDAQSGEMAGRCRDVGRWGSASFEAGTSGPLKVSEPGRYRVQLTLRKGRNTAWLATEMIVVANTDAEQAFAIAPAPDDLQKALAQIEAK